MKLLASGIVLVACCSALAQDLPRSYNSKTFSVLDVSKNVVVAFDGTGPSTEVLFIQAAKNANGVTGGTRAVTMFKNGSLIFVVPSSASAEMNKADSVHGAGDLVQLRGTSRSIGPERLFKPTKWTIISQLVRWNCAATCV